MPIGTYRKKPVDVQAIQWTRDTPMSELTLFANYLVRLNDVDGEFFVYDRLHDTWVEFDYDDWIIKGVQGEFYPCKGDIFAETYESAEPNLTFHNIHTHKPGVYARG